jgi:hypothetical protein
MHLTAHRADEEPGRIERGRAVNAVTQHRLALKAADFDPLPIDGKECHLVGWPSKVNVSATEIRSWQALAASRNTGILAKHAPGLDIDILNPDAADAVEQMVRDRFQDNGTILVRTGRSPKRLIPFSTTTPFAKITAKLISTDDVSEKLEWLADGQQFVAFGIHPDTGQPYRWCDGEPGSVHRSALPLIDGDAAVRMINDATDLLVAKFGYRRLERLPKARPSRTTHTNVPFVADVGDKEIPKPLYNELLRLMPLSDKVTRHDLRRARGILWIITSKRKDRNEALHDASCMFRELIYIDAATRAVAERLLFRAAELSGYVAKDGIAATMATIRSGLGSAGLEVQATDGTLCVLDQIIEGG